MARRRTFREAGGIRDPELTPEQEAFYSERPEHRPAAPIADIAQAAEGYRRQANIPSPFDRIPVSRYSRVMVDPGFNAAIGRAYQDLPEYDPAANRSFRSFRDETMRQYEWMTGRRSGLGLDVEVTPGDPYATPEEMRADLHRGRMKVLSTRSTGGHPFLSDDENDAFRAVHDVFGHAATGRGFDRHGEEAAWLHHSQMYSPHARPAMTTETRGQNSAFIFSLGGQDFPKQKIAALPQKFQDPTVTPRVQQAVFGRRSGGTPLGKQFSLF